MRVAPRGCQSLGLWKPGGEKDVNGATPPGSGQLPGPQDLQRPRGSRTGPLIPRPPRVSTVQEDVAERLAFAALRSRTDVALTVAALQYGDYSVAGQVSFERKTGEDLGLSIIDGRPFRQMSALRRRAVRPVLLLEGLRPMRAAAGVPWHGVRGALVSVAAVFGIPILHAETAEESAELIVTAARQLVRASALVPIRPGYRPKGWRRRALFVLQGLPGVGPRRAAALLDAFGSSAAVVSADVERLAAVEGVGEAVAAAIAAASGPEPPADPLAPPSVEGRRRPKVGPAVSWSL
jgi:DNA excision repair protein ERCC-4